ncbi:MAG: hypothetical protein ACRD1F_12985, partial [Terriglobales bacterium]
LGLISSTSAFWLAGALASRRYSNAEVTISEQISPALSLRAGAGPSWTFGQEGAGTGYAAEASLADERGATRLALEWSHALEPSFVPGGLTTDLMALEVEQDWSAAWRGSASWGLSRLGGFNTATASARAATAAQFLAGGLSYTAGAWRLSLNSGWDRQDLYSLAGLAPLRRLQLSAGVSYSLPQPH